MLCLSLWATASCERPYTVEGLHEQPLRKCKSACKYRRLHACEDFTKASRGVSQFLLWRCLPPIQADGEIILAANRELLALYWDIGRLILDRQKAEGWGTKVIDRLSRDLQNEFPGQQGFSPRNLKYMRAFAEDWPETVIVQPPVAQSAKPAIVQAPLAQTSPPSPAIVHQPGAQLPWKHHCLLLDKLSSPDDRLWFAAKAVEHGWSRNVLALQIESGLHTRQGKAVTNFKATLPPPQSDLVSAFSISACQLFSVSPFGFFQRFSFCCKLPPRSPRKQW